VLRAIPNLLAIAACDKPSDLRNRRISAQSSTLITPQAVLGVLNLHPSTTAQYSRDVDTRHLQERSGLTLKKLVQTLRAAKSATININGQHITLDPELPAPVQDLLTRLEGGH